MKRARTLPRIFASLFLAVLVLSLASGAEQAATRKMEFMDVLRLRSAASASISPDGQHVLYTVSELNWKEGRRFTDIWIASTDGSVAPRQMTFTPDRNESDPEWARDSRHFAFLSDRDGRQQLYLMRIDGGEARQVSDHKDGVNRFAFSRDGRWLAFSAGKPEERQIWLLDLRDGNAKPEQLTRHDTPVRNWDWAPDSSRIFFTAPDALDRDNLKRREKKFDVRIVDEPEPPSHLWSVAVSDKSERRWTEAAAWGVRDFTISRDGAWIAFRTASADRYENPLTQDHSEIYLLSLGIGELRRITENRVSEGAPRFSPDSRWFVFSAPDEFTPGRNTKLYLVPVAGSPVRKLLGAWDASAGSATWSADSKTLYFFEGIGVNQHLFAVSLEGDGTRPAQLTHLTGVLSGSFDSETGYFLLSRSTPERPADYYVARPADVANPARWTRVSDTNPQVAEFQLGTYETVRWKSTDGQTVEGILIKPVGYEPGRRYPLIVQLHGGPAAAYMNSFSDSYGTYVHIFAAHGYAVFQPNYRGSDNYGERFRMQIAGDYFRQAFDDILTGVDYLIAQGIADPDRLGMMGWSAGGHWSNWTLTHTDRFRAISTGAGSVNWISMYAQTDVQAPREFYFRGKPWENFEHYWDVSPLKYITNAKTPTLIHVGEADRRVPKPQSDELHMALKKLGVPTEYIVYPGMPHGLTNPRYQLVKMVAEFNWFEKWIRGKEGWFEWKTLLDTLEEK